MRMPRLPILLLTLLVLSPLWLAPQAAHGQQNPPYTLQDVVLLVGGGHSAARILSRVETDCISFRVNDAAVAELEKAGADSALTTGLRDVCYRAIATQTAAQPRQPQGVLEIIGELPPGWVRIVNELPPNTNRTITLTAGRPAVIIVTAPGWCPDRKELTMEGGEQQSWTPVLRGRPWVGSC